MTTLLRVPIAFTLFVAITTNTQSVLANSKTGINITMDNSDTLVANVPIKMLENGYGVAEDSPDQIWDWIADGGSISPGLVSRFNSKTGSSIPVPTEAILARPLAAEGTTEFTLSSGSYYKVTNNSEKISVWYFEVESNRNQFLARTSSLNLPVERVTGIGRWNRIENLNISTAGSASKSVPDSGRTLTFFGFSLAAIAFVRHRIHSLN